MTDWVWDRTLFEGTAPHYAKGRLPYAPGLADTMQRALGLDGSQRLLDVGCGPGTVTLLVAHLFDEVVGLDPDPGMLAEVARLAAAGGITNAQWVEMRAEELPGEDLGRFDVVTFAASFHWMDRDKVAATVRDMLTPSGVVIQVDNYQHALHDPVQPILERLRVRYLGADRRAGRGVRNSSQSGEEVVFRDAGFEGPEKIVVPDGRTIERTADDIVHFALSMSYLAPHLLGDRLDEFVADLRTALSGAETHPITLPENRLWIWRPAR